MGPESIYYDYDGDAYGYRGRSDTAVDKLVSEVQHLRKQVVDEQRERLAMVGEIVSLRQINKELEEQLPQDTETIIGRHELASLLKDSTELHELKLALQSFLATSFVINEHTRPVVDILTGARKQYLDQFNWRDEEAF